MQLAGFLDFNVTSSNKAQSNSEADRNVADKFYTDTDRHEVISLHLKMLTTKGNASFPIFRARGSGIEWLQASLCSLGVLQMKPPLN